MFYIINCVVTKHVIYVEPLQSQLSLLLSIAASRHALHISLTKQIYNEEQTAFRSFNVQYQRHHEVSSWSK